MKKSGLITFLILGFMAIFSTLSAQNKAAMQKIESARIALITDRLGLSPEQAQRFWPIYNEYSTQRRQLRSQLTEARKGIDPQTLTEQQSQQMMEQMGQNMPNMDELMQQMQGQDGEIPAEAMEQLKKMQEMFKQYQQE